VDRIKDCQAQLSDYLTTRKPDLLNEIAKQGALSDSLSAELKASLEQFKETWK